MRAHGPHRNRITPASKLGPPNFLFLQRANFFQRQLSFSQRNRLQLRLIKVTGGAVRCCRTKPHHHHHRIACVGTSGRTTPYRHQPLFSPRMNIKILSLSLGAPELLSSSRILQPDYMPSSEFLLFCTLSSSRRHFLCTRGDKFLSAMKSIG